MPNESYGRDYGTSLRSELVFRLGANNPSRTSAFDLVRPQHSPQYMESAGGGPTSHWSAFILVNHATRVAGPWTAEIELAFVTLLCVGTELVH
jgi:hypothetical protein